MTARRVAYLDGLRGVAILLVIGFHAYARFPTLVPYGGRFANITLFEYGYLGVELFFLISGYVILLSLEKTQNIITFLFNRWKRLFPAMLLSTLLIFFTARFFHDRPQGVPQLLDMVPGLTFIEPAFWSQIFQTKVSSLDGVFWTLYVEVKFYFIMSVLHAWFGTKKSVLALGFFFLIYPFCILMNLWGAAPRLLEQVVSLSTSQYFGWFVAGACTYLYARNRAQKRFLWLALFFVFLSTILLEKRTLGALFMTSVIAGLFFLPLISRFAMTVLQHRTLVFFGYISYPLYLIHQNILIASVIMLHRQFSWIPEFTLPFSPLLGLIILAYLMARYGEPYVRGALSRPVLPVRRVVQRRFYPSTST